MNQPQVSDRRAWMGLLARADSAEVEHLWRALDMEPAHQWLRAPEVGMIMLRGRAGGTGAPFNLGEMTVTRASVVLSGIEVVGHAWVQGRGVDHARIAALADALMQTPAQARVHAALIQPLAAGEAARRASRAAKAAATKVEFFTMVRGEA